jgi:methionine-gamma-lyase
MTKFITGTSDCVAGCVVSSSDFIASLNDINSGPSMLLGPVLDSIRAAGILKNLHGLHLRLIRHSQNALYLAQRFQEAGLAVHYPGIESHPQHHLMLKLMNPGFGFGGIVAIDVGNKVMADQLMLRMQEGKVGYLAVSLGYFKTLFSAPGHSTSSEIPPEERQKMGMGDGLIRFSVGLDNDIERTWRTIAACLQELGIGSGHLGQSRAGALPVVGRSK